MSSYRKSSKGLLSFKLKTIPLIILSTFSQYGQAEESSAKNNAATSLAQSSVHDDASEIGSVNVVRPMVLPSSAAKYDKSGSILLSAKDGDDNKVGTSAGAKEYARSLAKDKGKNDLPIGIQLQDIQVRAKRLYEIGPLRGLALTKEEIPGNVQSISAKEIKESHALSISDLMNSKLQSVNVNDYQSNPFQMDVTYRGFTASPQLGTAQGLSVFLDGVRVNEPFGDVVNWDMLPLNALAGLDVFPGSNPIFGLGTLGGALSMRTKSGFDAKEGTIEALGGSFNRKQIQGSVGGNNGVIAGFVAANIFNEDGWRDNSPSKVNQLFAKGEWRNEKLQLGLSALYAGNELTGNGLLPTEIAQQDRSSVFTSPDVTKNRLLQFQLTGLWDVTDTFNITGQIYKRKSRRNSSTGDMNGDFGGAVTRRPNPGENVSPGYADIDRDGLPDPVGRVANVAISQGGYTLDANGNPEQISGGFQQIGVDQDGNPIIEEVFINNPAFDASNLAIGTNFNTAVSANQGTQDIYDNDGNFVKTVPLWGNGQLVDGTFATSSLNNPTLPDTFKQAALTVWANRSALRTLPALENSVGLNTTNENGLFTFFSPNLSDLGNFDAGFVNNNGFYVALNYVAIVVPTNPDGSPILRAPDGSNTGLGKPLAVLVVDPVTGIPLQRNGADFNGDGNPSLIGKGTGYACDANGQNCTPTALITKTEIEQVTDGGAIQFNWNLEKHKFMIGASIDSSDASYNSAQYLGLLDNKRNAVLDPGRIGYEYAAASNPLGLNNFGGNSITKSLYFSETWTPVKEWSFTGAGRYNQTFVKNELAINNILGIAGPNRFLNFYNLGVLCNDNNNDGTVTADECPAGEILPFTVERANGLGAIGKGETEKFSYYSFNPSLGATWQPHETLNLYANWNKGARTPSVIELGCALDDTPVPATTNADGTPASYRPRSLMERRFCSLPSTLAGDPYLKQVRSETMELGARGYLTPELQWNATVYNTDLTDDIYFVSFTPDRSFFQNIGNTRRRGFETGIQGKVGKASFRLNYSLTDATFQSGFLTASPNNSSAGTLVQGDSLVASLTPTGYQQISVKPGDKIPGIPLHNLNASFNYEVTPDWNVGFTAILHSSAFVRGNENNKHRAGPASPIVGACSTIVTDENGLQTGSNCTSSIARPAFRYGGKTAGYAVFNLNTSYKLTKGLTAGLQISNLFNREYQSAGRLGLNPFSPSINGLVGANGFNYNSNDWRSSTFLAPGAPRAAYFTLTYDFDLGK